MSQNLHKKSDDSHYNGIRIVYVIKSCIKALYREFKLVTYFRGIILCIMVLGQFLKEWHSASLLFIIMKQSFKWSKMIGCLFNIRLVFYSYI